jgi:hypothetical protein
VLFHKKIARRRVATRLGIGIALCPDTSSLRLVGERNGPRKW